MPGCPELMTSLASLRPERQRKIFTVVIGLGRHTRSGVSKLRHVVCAGWSTISGKFKLALTGSLLQGVEARVYSGRCYLAKRRITSGTS